MISRNLLASLLIAGMVGCGAAKEGAGTPEGGVGTGDAGACGCGVQNGTLTVSWECYCAKWGCTWAIPACESFRNRQIYSECGLIAETVETAGGPWISVWDSSGKLVGSQSGSDTAPYACPSDPSLTAFQLRAGEFPAARCTAMSCSCGDGGTSCAPASTGS